MDDMNTALAGKVGDVQVNGISVVSNGVANVPPLAINSYGAAKVGTSTESGLELASTGILRVSYANASEIKSGTASTRKPIIPYNQHESTFYGLAQAALKYGMASSAQMR